MPRANPVPPTSSAASRRTTNVTLPEALLREARALAINVSQACERGLAAAVTGQRRARCRGRPGYVFDVQADLLSHVATGTVVPLLPMTDASQPIVVRLVALWLALATVARMSI